MELTLESPVQYIPRVGPSMAGKLARLDIKTVADLIGYAPFRYDDLSLVSEIAAIQPGETVSVKARVQSVKNYVTKNGKKLQEAVISDPSGSITAIFFNQPFLVRVLLPETTAYFAGKADWFGRKIALISPQYEPVSDETQKSLHTGRLVPVYPETAGVSSKWLRTKIEYLLEHGLLPETDYLPDEVKSHRGLPELAASLRSIHYPQSATHAQTAKHRLAFDELFLLALAAHERRRQWQTTEKARPLVADKATGDTFQKALPFRLTGDQERAIAQITQDLSRMVPMNRLLVGDVGSGKTAVAAFALFVAYKNGLSGALMAPTQILAEQHYETLHTLFAPLGIEISLVTAKTKPNRGTLLDRPPVWVGTHALLSETAAIDNLGLTVIDEQQRFGVQQRQLLRAKGPSGTMPHLLTMTATPIPRTVALTIFGSLDISTINEKPSGRLPVKTWVVPGDKRQKAYGWIKNKITAEKTQAFVVCPLIDASESSSTVKSARTEFERLSREIFPDLKLGLVHGRLKAREKTAVLENFRTGRLDILVATPVVEVGIDIPNARIILIEGAERFGLSQLHQLRGRVGRDITQSYCLLFSGTEDENALARVKTLETVHSGPLLSEVDLALRGPGELFGTRQHGLPKLKYASFMDIPLLTEIGEDVSRFTEKHPDLTQFTLLREKLKTITIMDVPQD